LDGRGGEADEASLLNDERISIVERHGTPDGVPVTLFLGSHFFTGFLGISMLDYLRDPDVMIEAQVKVRERFMNLFRLQPDYSIVVEAESLGCSIKLDGDNPPLILPAMKSPEDIGKMKVPECFSSRYAKLALDTYKRMRFRAGGDAVSFWTCLGPFDLACLVRGQSEFFADLRLRPGLAHGLLRITTKTLIEWTRLREECVGEPFARVGIGDDFPGFAGPGYFREFFVPYAKEFFESFPNRVHYWHSDGDTSRVLQLIPELGIDVFNNFYPDLDLSVFKERLGGRMALIGNVHPLKVMLRGSVSDVERECRRQLAVGSPGGGYAISTGGGIPRGVPEENIWAMISAALGKGKKAG
jgi:uroporphyrinogen decarboxylase